MNYFIEKKLYSFRSCPLLLLDEEIKFDDIVQQILIPAYNAQKGPFLEALASILGQLSCILSQSGTIVR